MSERMHQTLIEAQERSEAAARGSKTIAVATAIIAVLAALGTLFSHHRSISAITSMNHAILFQTRASDKFSTYEAVRVRTNILRALVQADIAKNDAAKKLLTEAADKNETVANSVLEAAQDLEDQSRHADERSETILQSYETLELATTLAEVAIVLVSIAALAHTRILVIVGCSVAGIGLILLVYGLFQGR